MVSPLLTRACTVEIIALGCMEQGQHSTATTAPTTVTSKTQANNKYNSPYSKMACHCATQITNFMLCSPATWQYSNNTKQQSTCE